MSLRPAAILLATLTALMAIAGDWSGDALAGAWKIPAALLLAGLAYESFRVSRSGIVMVIQAPDLWFLGRQSTATLVMRHQATRAVALQIAPAAPRGFAGDLPITEIAVPAAQASRLDVRLTPRDLGAHAWPVVRVRIGGDLRLAWWPRLLHDECSIRVVPDLMRRGPAIAGADAGGLRTGFKSGVGGELLQLRPYRDGDPPRVVDWKATARAGRLISRDFSEDQHLEIIIVIDAGRASGLRAGNLDRFGHYVNVAAGLAQYAASQGDLVGLMLFAERPLLELEPARGTAAVTRIRKALSGARVTGAESNALHAALRVRTLARQRSLVVVLTDLDDASVASQLAGAARVLLPKHLPLIAGLTSHAAEKLARAPATQWVEPYNALAAQEYCASLGRKVRALRALGAPALVARPDELERAVLEAYTTFRRQRRV